MMLSLRARPANVAMSDCRFIVAIIFLFVTQIGFANASEFNLSEASLHQKLVSISPEHSDWVDENNILDVHTENVYLAGLLADLLLVEQFENIHCAPDTVGCFQSYFDLFVQAGESQDIFADNFTTADYGITSALNDKLLTYGADQLGIGKGWRYYKNTKLFIETTVGLSSNDELVRLKAFWNVVESLTGPVGAVSGMYMSFLFDAVDQFQNNASKLRLAWIMGAFHKSKTTSYFQYFDENHALIPGSELDRLIRGGRSDVNSIEYNWAGSEQEFLDYMAAHYGYGGLALDADEIDSLIDVATSLNRFFYNYRKTNTADYDDAITEYIALIQSEMYNASDVRDVYSSYSTENPLKLSKSTSQSFYTIYNTGETKLTDLYLEDTDGFNDQSPEYDVLPDQLLEIYGGGLDSDPERIRFQLFNVPMTVSVSSIGGLKEIVARIRVSDLNPSSSRLKAFEVVVFDVKSNLSIASNVLYEWNFGDGNVATGQGQLHTYYAPSTYTVTLRVTSASGVSEVFTKDIVVEENEAAVPLIPTVTASQYYYEGGDSITLTANSGSSLDEPITYTWQETTSANSVFFIETVSAGEVSETVVSPEFGNRNYYVKASNSAGESSLSSISINETGITEQGDYVFEPYTVTNPNGTTTVVNQFHRSGQIDGNVYLKGGTFDLQGKVLVINGDLIHSAGVLNVNNGWLVVNGNYRIQTDNGDEGYGYSTGKLLMTNESDNVLVKGDFYMDSYFRHTTYLTAGTLNLLGKFTQLSSHPSTSEPTLNFAATGSHKVVLSGAQKQTVHFDDPGINGYTSRFASLELRNNSNEGVDFITPAVVSNNITSNGGPITGGLSSFKLSDDLIFSGNLTPQLNSGTIDLNGHTLSVGGNVVHGTGVIKINGGRLVVGDDYRIQNDNGTGGYSYSTGKLLMTNESDSVLVKGDFYMDTYHRHTTYLTAGTLNLLGNFNQLSSHPSTSEPTLNFAATGSHKVVLSGAQKQTVHFDDPGINGYTSRFASLELRNNSNEGVDFITPAVVSNNITSNGGPITGGLSSFRLSDDLIFNGNLTPMLNSGTIDLNGHTLSVSGNVVHGAGVITINGGRLVVGEDYRIQTDNGDAGYGYSIGKLLMTNELDSVLVKGDFYMDTYHRHTTYLTAGTLNLLSNFNQLSSHPSTSEPTLNFAATGSHKVVLSGAQKQTVHFDDPGINGYTSRFASLELRNNSNEGVDFVTPAVVSNNITSNGGPITGGLSSFRLSDDLIFNGNLTPMLNSGTIDLNGHTLSVSGNVVHGAGVITINGGRLVVGEDYRIQTDNGDAGYGYSIGKLLMTNESDSVLVKGGFYMDSYYRHTTYLTAGTLNLLGNFSQLSSHPSTSEPSLNFAATGSHKVVLSGAQEQRVHFDDPGVNGYSSRFASLQLNNNSTAGVNFETKTVVSTLFNHNRLNFSLFDDSDTNFVDYDNDGLKDHVDPYPLDPNNQSVNDTDGDLTEDSDDNCPNIPNADQADLDLDGAGDVCDSDIDGDGMPNSWELQYGLDSYNASDANMDTDNDGISNLNEYLSGSDPTLFESNNDVGRGMYLPVIIDLLMENN